MDDISIEALKQIRAWADKKIVAASKKAAGEESPAVDDEMGEALEEEQPAVEIELGAEDEPDEFDVPPPQDKKTTVLESVRIGGGGGGDTTSKVADIPGPKLSEEVKGVVAGLGRRHNRR